MCNFAVISSTLAWLPLVNFSVGIVAFVTPFVISYKKGFNHSLLPFISDVGTTPPASGWFTLFLNAIAYSLCLISYIRYHQLKMEANLNRKLVKAANRVGLLVGILASIGLSLVAAIQETATPSVHFTGAMTAFVCLALFAFIQTYLTFVILPNRQPCVVLYAEAIFALRILLTLVCIASLVTTLTIETSQKFPPKYSPHESGNVVLYYSCTGSEWLLGISCLLYGFTFAYDFSRIELKELIVKEGHGRLFDGLDQDLISNSRDSLN